MRVSRSTGRVPLGALVYAAVALGCGGRTAVEGEGSRGATSNAMSAGSSDVAIATSTGPGASPSTSTATVATSTAASSLPPIPCDPNDPCPLRPAACDGHTLVTRPPFGCINGYCVWVTNSTYCEAGCTDGACLPLVPPR
jgi:hypothetical protein